MGTEFWHPGSRDMSEHFERERRESEKLVLDALGQIRADTAEVNRKTGEMYTALFGPASMPHMASFRAPITGWMSWTIPRPGEFA